MRIRNEVFSLLAPLLGLLICVGALRADEAPLDCANFFELQKRMLSLSELEWRERVATAETWQKERREVQKNLDEARSSRTPHEGHVALAARMSARLESTSARYRSHRATLMANFQTSSATFSRFARENRDVLEQYLSEHPSVRTELDSLKARVDGLIQRFESLMEQSREGEPK